MTVSNDELDALRELLNIGVGRAAGALHGMIGRPVQLNVPLVTLVAPREVAELIGGAPGQPLTCVRLRFDGGLRGSADLLFPVESSRKLVALLAGGDSADAQLDAQRSSMLTEVGNILLNSLMGAITNFVRERLDYGLPIYVEETAERIASGLLEAQDAAVLLAQAQFFVAGSAEEALTERIDGEITLLLGVDSLAHLLHRVQHLDEEVVI
jgi:chemotaxis protein CheC